MYYENHYLLTGTIYLTLYEMFKEPTTGHNTGNLIQNLQTIKKTIRPMHRELEGGSRLVFIIDTPESLHFLKSIVVHPSYSVIFRFLTVIFFHV